MSQYSAAIATADRLIGRYGARLTFSRRNGTFDPLTQQQSGEVKRYIANAVVSPLSEGRSAFLFGPGAQNVLKPRLSVQIALSGLADQPQVGDGFSWSGSAWRLESVQVINPDGLSPIVASALAERA